MHVFSGLQLKKCLVAGVALAVIIPATPVLADTTSTTAATTDNTITQTANTGTATVSDTPVDTTPSDTTLPDTPVVTNPIIDTQTQTPTDTTSNSPDPVPTSTSNTDGNTQNANSNNNTNTTVNNNQDSQATSGDATVQNNQQGGNATTGDSLNQTTLVNLLNSITGLNSGQLSTFVTNVTGDVNGNLTIDPSSLGALNPTNQSNQSSPGNVNLNNNSSSQINNNVYLAANSGDATVADNGVGGNATTGNATNELNLVNLLNSAISSGNSFLGIINIFGNLNGNIYLPTGFLDSLLASNPTSAGSSTSGNVDINNANTSIINNDITQIATSGNATVAGNGQGGNAITGNATNNLNLFNLTNQQVIGSNDLIVFVNVLGTWVGFITNAPAGTTTAEFGSGVAGPVTGSNGTDLQLDNNTNSQINNTIYMAATTGNAYVLDNGVGGNATTGNATNSANILNIINSSLHLNGWFGMLFINVFGSWNGNLAEAPVIVVPVNPVTPPTTGSPTSANTGNTTTNNYQPTYHLATTVGNSNQAAPEQKPTNGGHILAASSNSSNGPSQLGAVKTFNWIIPVGGFCIAIALYFCVDRAINFAKNR